MLHNYLKTALRSLAKNRVSAFINIAGLSAGMAVAMLTGLWIWDEFSYNKSFANYNSITQLKANANYNGVIQTVESHPMPLGTELRNVYKDYFKQVIISTATEQHVLAAGDKRFTQAGNYMQAEAPDMFSLNMLQGKRQGLKEPGSILLSASLANKLFGSAGAVNKVIKIDNQFVVKVTGVYQDFPDNTDFKNISYIAPFDFYLSSYNWAQKKYTDWNNLSINIYAQLNPGADAGRVSAAIKKVLATHASGNLAKRKPELFLQPMSKWRLYNTFGNGVNVTSAQLRFIWFYGTTGIFVLLLACINFMNLSTARSQKRAKEVGIRKTMGSARGNLVKQFFTESLLVAFFSFMVCIALVQLALPWFNGIAGKKIILPVLNPAFWAAGIAFTAFTGLVAGCYPALYLSSFNPVKVLKGTFRTGRLAALPRKALVVMQFTVSIALIIGTIVVYRQVQFAKNRPVGYSQESLLQVAMNSPEFEGKYDIFRNELKSTGAVEEVAQAASPVTSVWSTNTGFSWQGGLNTQQTEFATINITPEYGKTLGWQFTQGGDFNRETLGDSSGLVLNESAVKLMGLKNPTGQNIEWDAVKNKHFNVLGVVKDMVMESPFSPVYPAIFFVYPRDGMNYMFIKLRPGTNATNALAKVEAVFKKLAPSAPFAYSFVNDDFNKKFEAEERTGTLAGVFAVLAVFISCLGLFGLASFMAEQRTKEIGVRKVLGASVVNVWLLLSKDFAVLVIISLFIASPLAYYFMHNWLMQYALRAELAWWVFAATGAGALTIALATVSYESIKAALMSPVRSLKVE